MIQDHLDPFKTAVFAGVVTVASVVYYLRSRPSHADIEAKYQGGESYASPSEQKTGLIKDLTTIGFKAAQGDLKTLLDVAFSKGKPIDDRKMTMEHLIAFTGSLPETSKLRDKLTKTVVDGLWASLQHPPLSYVGTDFQYRKADGSYNNIMTPNLGAAGTPYARAVTSQKKLHVVRPDPGLLFDMLMARPDGQFKENPAGISSVLFYHATIIIHDIFRTNRTNPSISDTSSYLDLAPVYGSSVADQKLIRTFSGGLLKPDTYHEERLLAQPPGVNVILVFYSRFHNYVASTLLKINEGNRFSVADGIDKELALAKQDEDLFQTARLIVGGLYINICLHDYLRGLTNTHHSNSSWTLDPRVDINSTYDGTGVPRGIGNQVSCEFNLLYRFHSVISLRDEAWLNEFFSGLFPGLNKPLSELDTRELLQKLWEYEQSIPKDPSVREFGGLKRGSDGKFKDEDLVRIMKESIEDPAGNFGARNVPKALRVVEILGILQSRKWGTASLNEFRDFFGLQKQYVNVKIHYSFRMISQSLVIRSCMNIGNGGADPGVVISTSFEDVNSDPDVADTLRSLYDDVDMLELYPGLFVEEAKQRLDPGCGGCPPYTVGRAVFSDAVTLVRSDRFYTVDYNASTLTNWGMAEVAYDLKTLGGSMFYKLIQRAVPNWFPYNSLHVMQPMYTKAMNYQIAKEIGQDWLYTMDDPTPPRPPHVLVSHSLIVKVLGNQRAFKAPWVNSLNQMIKGKRYDDFMLCGDLPLNTAQRNLVGDIMYGPTEFKGLLLDFVAKTAKQCLNTDSFPVSKASAQIDIIRDVAIPTITHLLGDLFSLDLFTPENTAGEYGVAELYGHLIDVRTWGFSNNDPALAWNRRRKASEGAINLSRTTENVVKKIAGISGHEGLLSRIANGLRIFNTDHGYHPEKGSLRWYGSKMAKELLAAGKTTEQVSEILWNTAIAGVGATVATFSEVMVFFLDEKNLGYWADVQKLAADDTPEADRLIKTYTMEAQRLSSAGRDVRFVAEDTTINGQRFKAGDVAICMLGMACMDPEAFPNSQQFKLDRDPKSYIHFGSGPHACLGREVALTYVTALVKVSASLKNLRTAPGEMGMLRKIQMGTERCYLTDDWAYLTFDPTTWKLHYDGFGRGVGHHDPGKTGGKTLSTVYQELKQKDKEARADANSSSTPDTTSSPYEIMDRH